MNEHSRHDWRVVPTQVIFSNEGVDRVEIHCADCNKRSFVQTRRLFSVNVNNAKTWRPFLFRAGDQIES